MSGGYSNVSSSTAAASDDKQQLTVTIQQTRGQKSNCYHTDALQLFRSSADGSFTSPVSIDDFNQYPIRIRDPEGQLPCSLLSG